MGTTCLHLGTLEQSLVFENKVNSEKVKLSLRNFPHNDYEDVFEEPSESGSDPSMWTARGPFRRDRWSSEDEEAAGPSQALSPLLSVQHHGYSGPNERTTFWHGSNEGAVSLLLRYCA
ncbi:tyrosine-protein phosphatase non-receptor type 20 isoform 21 [Homo sapiens]|uniref:tyrosine-protein phosphatase non-receptor type 20 isoform 21 n=1 Tax=Homo sapiens TaxID=9606 RepID=UPI0000577666|nr:tyrosine-protein phosphatase non-receptor type 20 isoform 21 [Homo sapiens]NP_001339471.1 tyrosine-protein phosphatase non-receptor type 20 isoform 21 [Homo sapiens]|eukprot:NP_001339470.1 tyrosine-protein phosphatase non-receptor type 20 isoform 21 [Homo sapiens]